MSEYPELPSTDGLWAILKLWNDAPVGPEAGKLAERIEGALIGMLKGYVDSDRAERAGWLPIESAPKDGTPILVCDMKSRIPAAEVVHWNDGWLSGTPDYWEDIQSRGRGLQVLGMHETPTYWQPLPQPPEA